MQLGKKICLATSFTTTPGHVQKSTEIEPSICWHERVLCNSGSSSSSNNNENGTVSGGDDGQHGRRSKSKIKNHRVISLLMTGLKGDHFDLFSDMV